MPQNARPALVGIRSGAPHPLLVDASYAAVPGITPVAVSVTTAAIGGTNTFQIALAANTARRPGGTITNNGTNLMQVFFGAGTASAAKAIDLAGGATLYLAQVFGPQQVYTGVIQMTGTAADTFGITELTAA